MHELSALGWSPFFDEQWQRCASPEWVPALVAAEHRGAYEVWAAAGTGLARLAGRLRHELEPSAIPGVGDWVALDGVPSSGNTVTVQHVCDRKTVFLRGAAGRAARAQVVAANVDLVFVVCGLDADYNLNRVERYLTRIWASGAEPWVVLSKLDLCPDGAARVAEVEERCPGVTVRSVSALQREGLEALRGRIRPGTTVALVGSSGAGKSTLLNALLGEARMTTGAVRASDGRGQHVTTHRQLVLLPQGGLLLDTPGMRELQLVDAGGLSETFEEVDILAQRCRFADCQHTTEPGCAVRAAVAAGQLDAARLENFEKLEREARAQERRHDERLRRETERAWGKMVRRGNPVRRGKRSE